MSAENSGTNDGHFVPSNVLPLDVAAARLGVSAEWLIEAGCPHCRIARGRHRARGQRFVVWPVVEQWIAASEKVGEWVAP